MYPSKLTAARQHLINLEEARRVNPELAKNYNRLIDFQKKVIATLTKTNIKAGC